MRAAMNRNEIKGKVMIVEIVEAVGSDGEVTTTKKHDNGLIVIRSPELKRQWEKIRRNFEDLRERHRFLRATHPLARFDSRGNEVYNPGY